MKHPSQSLDDTVHQKTRLGLLAVLVEVRRADFGYLKEALDLTDGNLSRHLQVLEEAGYVETSKVFENRKPRTWVKVTKAGRSALNAELSAMRALIQRLDGAPR